ncbi:ABC transporter ATP-binding protein [Pseudomonas savastanoi pv. retacarpa]|uniref:ABC transporter ATP-binding protein n=3 Tax=Pseudomonas savastanoi TaxID=29438 RepID=A0A267JYD0_PSESS|nr:MULTISPECIES: ABC transporter ATP-binding protein [Pseudomonas]ARD12303.1 ABC transporter ATP-binding protein [Pseudomonas savastanoi pv. savastanoi NCPPB 3335]KAA3549019.1 ABC transporter ATP-binding protein [Pseudomonas savastanoi]KPB20023.1 ABC transporter ATP-binding protein [Pseudomonas savastanoi]KPW74248.1 Branched-chain amino acid ABC transporter, ATP-binding protein [Pseudomonas amygdali pv. ciccaronei]KPY40563.1 Branched-chain amino acid ABC transporter, ATP-binding protein [Pseud
MSLIPHAAPAAETILSVEQVEVFYEQSILALRGISLQVRQGQIVALLGANGAGKSTTLKAISRLVSAERGEVVSGRIHYQGLPITHSDPSALVKNGLAQVLEGRHCFTHLSVEQNLLIGAFVSRPSRAEIKARLERVYSYFPRLRLLRKRLTGYTSGGEQQMVAIGRALMSQPRLLLLDEPSMGLAPQVVEEIFDTLAGLNREEGLSLLVAEQNINLTLEYAHFGYVLENGRVVGSGTAQELAGREDIQSFYLGTATQA